MIDSSLTMVVAVLLQIFAFDYCFWSIDSNNPKFSGEMYRRDRMQLLNA